VCASQTSSSTPQVVGALTTRCSAKTHSFDDGVSQGLDHGFTDDFPVGIILTNDRLGGDDWQFVDVSLASDNSATLSFTGVQVLEDAGWVEVFDTLGVHLDLHTALKLLVKVELEAGSSSNVAVGQLSGSTHQVVVALAAVGTKTLDLTLKRNLTLKLDLTSEKSLNPSLDGGVVSSVRNAAHVETIGSLFTPVAVIADTMFD